MQTKFVAPIAALLTLASGGGLGFWMSRTGEDTRLERDADNAVVDAEGLPDDLVRQSRPIYYDLKPPLTANLKNTPAVLQAGISLSTHYAETNDSLKNDDPALRSAILFALAGVQPDTANDDEQKRALLTQIVRAVNGQLKRDGYRGTVDEAYFTSFVVQDNQEDDV